MAKLAILKTESEELKKVSLPNKDLMGRALWIYALALVLMAISFHRRP